jgi:DNA invertase Pin-like site-specific DNA recombinase
MGKRAAIYVRVITDEQSLERQEDELRAVADRMGARYQDRASGAKGRDKCPGFDALHRDARAASVRLGHGVVD